MTRYATNARSGILVVSDVPLYTDENLLRRLLACWSYYVRKHVWS